MLVSLSIRDFILIGKLDLSFGPGLSVLTGETGAGKSILLDALGLALGGRADSALVRPGAEQASVTAEFSLPPKHPVLALLKDQGLEAETALILRRTVGTDGRSRAFANDQPVSVALLRQLGGTLVEIHGQFDTHGLLDPQTHRDVLDAFGGLQADVAKVRAAYETWKTTAAAREEAARQIEAARREEDFLRHALEELDTLDPQADEENELASRRQLLMNAGKILENMESALAALAGESGAVRSLFQAQKALSRLGDRLQGVEQIVAALDRVAVEVDEAVAGLEALGRSVDQDPRALDQVEERLYALRALARKHSVSVSDLPALRQDMARRLDLIETQGDTLSRLAREEEEKRTVYAAVADRLGKARRKAVVALDKKVAAELGPLKLDRAVFTTQVEMLAEADWSPSGQDRVTFAVATNPGAPPGPLNRIASGGELARFMLALKVVLAKADTVPVLVFDEVDTGIGGAVAAAVGERLAKLAKDFQVLVVTHSPQVAARGDHHWKVQKNTRKDITVTNVVALEQEHRREEIARMLSGATVTDQARAAADSLLGE
ncbi:MAG: DNA repair protein RecN [Pseudomonadota bacterium]|nr:DNA repair protein RecN [Pseudomonadota bacterium]